MIKTIFFILFVMFCSSFLLESHQTHISKPILSLEKTQYQSGELVSLKGVVIYDDNPTSDVLLQILVSDPNEKVIVDAYTISLDDGTIFVEFLIPENSISGEYEIDVTSLCREVHREICTHQYEIVKFNVADDSLQDISIPDWIKNLAKWWFEGNIDDSTYASAFEFMIKEEIIIVPLTDKQESVDTKIPDWLKKQAKWWSEGTISDKDYVAGLQFLIANGIISV